MRSFSRISFLVFLALLLPLVVVTACSGGEVVSHVTISALTVVPAEVTPGQIVTVGANVLNSGKNAEEYSASLKINEEFIETKQLTVAPGETQTLVFQYTPSSAGSYTVEINSQTAAFSVLRPAAFTVDSLTVQPASPLAGDNLTADYCVHNDGDLKGEYLAALRVDGQSVVSSRLTLDAASSENVTFIFSVAEAGLHTVETADLKQEIRVLKPAELKCSAVQVTPTSAWEGEIVMVEATISNAGEVRAADDVDLWLNGSAYSHRAVALEPGETQKYKYVVTAGSPGVYKVDVLGAGGSFFITGLSRYTSKNAFYTISYPPEFVVDEQDDGGVYIEKEDVGGLSILVDRVSTEQTFQDYYTSCIATSQEYYDNYSATASRELTQRMPGNAYYYDCSYSDYDGVKYLGLGLIFRNAGFGYNVEFSTPEADWAKYKFVAGLSIESFLPPLAYTGFYSNPSLGITLNLPAGWCILETGLHAQPLMIFPTRDNPLVSCVLALESVNSTVTAAQFLNNELKQVVSVGWTLGSGKVFVFEDGTSGYQRTLSMSITDSLKWTIQVFCQIKNGRAIILLYQGPSTEIASLSGRISETSRSLIISKRSGISSFDPNDSIFLAQGEISTLDPALVEMGPGDVIGAIFSGLVGFDASLNVAPDLAESWQVSDNGTTYTFALRHNAHFQDGKALTAADVIYSWDRACDPALKSPRAAAFLSSIVGARARLDGSAVSISGLTAVDTYTLQVNLVAAQPYFLSELAQPVAFVVDKANVEKGSRWDESPNGSGAFKLKTWVKDGLLVLERNDQFYLEPAKAKNLVFKLYAGLNLPLYQAGEIDIAPVSLTDQDAVLDTTNPLNKELVTGFVYDIGYLGFNVTKPPLDDIRIRQALALSLDIPKLIEVSLKGRAARATGFVPPGIPGYNPELPPLSFNLEKARQLIAESQYGSAANVPAITIYCLYQVSPLEQAVIGMWQALGIKVSAVVMNEQKDYLARSHRRDFQVFISGWRADYLDPRNFLETFFQSQSVDNGFAYNNPDVDASLAKAALENDPAVRLKMYREIEKMVLEDLPAVPLFWQSQTFTLVKPYIKGFKVYPLDINIWRELSVIAH